MQMVYVFIPFYDFLKINGGSDDVINLPTQFTIDPPSVATLNSPENNKVCEEGTSVSETQSSVTFQWTAGSNTDSYDLMLTFFLNSNQIINQTNISETNKAVTLNNSPYSWKVTSKRNGTTETSDSSIWKFYLSGAWYQ